MTNKASFLVFLCFIISSIAIDMNNPKAVYTIPYTRTFRKDLFAQSMGCGHNVVYSGYQYPSGPRDTIKIYTQTSTYGLSFSSCRPKDVYAKIFGYAQDYNALKESRNIVDSINKDLRNIFKIIIDWKQIEGDLGSAKQFLNRLINQLRQNGKQVYLKVPASYLCLSVNDSPYILGIDSAINIIVEMYGESPVAYKNLYDIFQSQNGNEQRDSKYPSNDCPKFPSYRLLSDKFPNKKFYIEKTLQQQEPGFLGKQFDNILRNVQGLYSESIFYDAFPPNLIRI